MKKLMLIITTLLLLVGCGTQYAEKPIPEEKMGPIADTKFGKEVVRAILAADIYDAQMREVLQSWTEADLVLEIQDMILQQEFNNETGNWQIIVLMTSDTHLFSCSVLGEGKNISGEATVTALNDMFNSVVIHGSQKDLEDSVIKSVKKEIKVCLAIPYAGIMDLK